MAADGWRSAAVVSRVKAKLLLSWMIGTFVCSFS